MIDRPDPLVALQARLEGPAATLPRVAQEAVERLDAAGVVHAEIGFAPLTPTAGLEPDAVVEAVVAAIEAAGRTGLRVGLIVGARGEEGPQRSVEAAKLAARHAGPVVGFDLSGGEPGQSARDHAEAFEIAGAAGLGRIVHGGGEDGVQQIADALDTGALDRIVDGRRLIEDCRVEGGRIVGLGRTAARVRDSRTPVGMGLSPNTGPATPAGERPVRALVDAGFRVTLEPEAAGDGFDRVELAAGVERAAAAAFLGDDDRRALIASVRQGWNVTPSRLVHLAERSRWEDARSGGGAYLPAEWLDDGFIHLSARHQLLTPANRFYRGRTDLIALELDAGLLGDAVVWEPGTGTFEYFPHLYAALHPDAVVAEYVMTPGPDGGFLLPAGL